MWAEKVQGKKCCPLILSDWMFTKKIVLPQKLIDRWVCGPLIVVWAIESHCFIVEI